MDFPVWFPYAIVGLVASIGYLVWRWSSRKKKEEREEELERRPGGGTLEEELRAELERMRRQQASEAGVAEEEPGDRALEPPLEVRAELEALRRRYGPKGEQGEADAGGNSSGRDSGG